MTDGTNTTAYGVNGINMGGVTVNKEGINANSKVISNVAHAVSATDAVNLAQVASLIQNAPQSGVSNEQLNKTYETLASSLGGNAYYENGTWRAPEYTIGSGVNQTTVKDVGSALSALSRMDDGLSSRIDLLNQRLDASFQTTNRRIDQLEKNVNAGIASALALEAPAYVPGGLTYAVGTAFYRGQNAVGISFRRTSDNGRWSVNVGVSADSQGTPAFRIGMGGLID